MDRPAHGTGHKGKGFGMAWSYTNVLVSTSGRLRTLLEEAAEKKVHLCRESPCQDPGRYALHAPAYGHCKDDADTNLNALVESPRPRGGLARAANGGAAACGRACGALGFKAGARSCTGFGRRGRTSCAGRRYASDTPMELRR